MVESEPFSSVDHSGSQPAAHQSAAKIAGDYDLEVDEAHHRDGLGPIHAICLGTFEIAERCSSSGCGGEAVAAMPLLTPEGDPDVLWACADHAEALRRDDILIRKIFRMCGLGDPGGSSCETLATHVLVSDVAGQLRLKSVCARHAAMFETP